METTSEVLVDLNDRFFFDHEYDHMPGLLVFDAAWRAVMNEHPRARQNDTPLMSMRLSFEHWFDLDKRTELRLGGTRESNDAFNYKGEFGQMKGNQWIRCARFVAVRKPMSLPCAMPSQGISTRVKPLSLTAAHKRHPQNVLVSEVDRDGDLWACSPIKQPGHVVFEGRTTYSPTHLVEMGRQLFTGMADQIAEQTPELDRHFVMTSLKLDLTHQINHDAELKLELRPGKVRHVGKLEIARQRIILKVDGESYGTIMIIGHAIDEGDYNQHRGLEHDAVTH